MGYHSLLQGIFLTQGSDPCLLSLLSWQACSLPSSTTRKDATYSASVHSFSCVRLFVTPWIVARQASMSITNSQSLLRLMYSELVMPSSHLILCCTLLLLPQSLPASESFPVSQFFSSDAVSASASVLPMNMQD